MDGKICYLNTDLDMTSSDDLAPLAAVFESGGMFTLHLTSGEDGLWHATFEVLDQHTEPEPNIAAMFAVAESLDEPSARSGCLAHNANSTLDTIAVMSRGLSIEGCQTAY
jgi:hypothetical protein